MNEANEARPSPRRLANRLAALALFAWGMALCLHYGRVGFMPLDQSIVWDGGYRLLTGQVPFRDFTTPAGLVPMAMQAAWFRLFGIDWFAYCLHAAILNGLFCVLAFRLLRGFGLAGAPAGLYALASGVVFYPPFGVPYMDQHAFFFSLAATCALAEGVLGRNGRTWRLALVPWLLAAACLSKQIPSLFVAPLLLALPWLADRSERPTVWRPLLASAAVLGAVTALAAAGTDHGLLAEYFFVLPGTEGRRRILGLLEAAAFRGQFAELSRALPPWSTALTAVGAALVLAPAGLLGPRPDRGRRAGAALGLGLLAVCAAFVMATDNQGENGIAFVFVAAGLVHAGLAPPPFTVRGLRPAIALALAAACGAEAWQFNHRVNETRMVHELSGVAPAPAASLRALPPALSFMEWRLHPFYRFSPEDLALTVAFLRSQPGAIYVFGDLTPLYALTGRPSVGPAVWLHPGLTLPEPGQPGFTAWEERLVRDLEARKVRFVVRESRQTYNELRLSQLPALVAHIEARKGRRRSFGGIDVIELRPDDAGADAPR